MSKRLWRKATPLIDEQWMHTLIPERTMAGFGSYEDPAGAKYQGDWKDGVMHGQGVCDTADGERKLLPGVGVVFCGVSR